ncbi:rhsD protein [Caballeronia turbans]|uniref:hypothetical protein n=1 Tax=Caballeronia sp. INML3B TaxID=2921749 RepID=UPI00074BB41B|nr:hypothetical protein [Caballeronia sp. INML3B]SAL55646.1 rhsD protein [Caballeronia turbans]
MALLAVTHLTPVIGVDVHLIQTFAGPTLPLPHPHVGMVFDPMEYLSLLPEGVGNMVSMGMMAMGAASIVKMGMRSFGAAAVGVAAMAVQSAAGGGGGPYPCQRPDAHHRGHPDHSCSRPAFPDWRHVHGPRRAPAIQQQRIVPWQPHRARQR